jgi:perosamine synthetase
MRIFRSHGIGQDPHQRQQQNSWFYEMSELGYNYRLSDIQCALGLSQLSKLAQSVARRQEIAAAYEAALAEVAGVHPLAVRDDVSHAYHLYVVQLDTEALGVDRGQMFRALRAEGIGVNVHYIPVHLHPYYQGRFGTRAGLCPKAEAAYERILSLPMFAGMTESDVADVLTALRKVLTAYRR